MATVASPKAQLELSFSANATRHGMLAWPVVLDQELASAFESRLDSYSERVCPSGCVELHLVDVPAPSKPAYSARHRQPCHPLERITAAFTTLNPSSALPLITRYDCRLRLDSALFKPRPP